MSGSRINPFGIFRDDKRDWGDDDEGMVGDRIYYVYLLASRPFGTLYCGMTSDIIARTFDHKSGAIPGFTEKYGVHRLVWFEHHREVENAIVRETHFARARNRARTR